MQWRRIYQCLVKSQLCFCYSYYLPILLTKVWRSLNIKKWLRFFFSQIFHIPVFSVVMAPSQRIIHHTPKPSLTDNLNDFSHIAGDHGHSRQTSANPPVVHTPLLFHSPSCTNLFSLPFESFSFREILFSVHVTTCFCTQQQNLGMKLLNTNRPYLQWMFCFLVFSNGRRWNASNCI